jgi:mRNA N6-methyladenine demethylase
MPDYPGPRDRFIVHGDVGFDEAMKKCYGKCVVDTQEKFPDTFHNSFMTALDNLEKEGAYQFDLTQPAGLGTKVAKTFVTRCLVGEAGTTYKYLGLRMFSIPWNAGETGASESAVTISRLNQRLIEKTHAHLKTLGKPPSEVGSCEYNLTLINKYDLIAYNCVCGATVSYLFDVLCRCFPVAESTLKVDPSFGKDKVTVSWHADSTLDHFSTIAVYHCTKPSAAIDADAGDNSSRNPAFQDESWRVAMRVWLDAEGPNQGKPSSRTEEMRDKYVAPAVAVALPKKAAYYLLDDFNHHHQHAVLAGTTHRYASTHRVCRTDGHTFQSIKSRCVSALQGTEAQYGVTKLRAEQLTMTEVEFEWIRQFYVQGQKHHDFHAWWRTAIAVLLDYYTQLQLRTLKALETLYDAAMGVKEDSHNADMSNRDRKVLAKRSKAILSVTAESYEVLATALRDVRT